MNWIRTCRIARALPVAALTVLCCAVPRSAFCQSKDNIPLPEYYGIYAVVDNQLVKLDSQQIRANKTVPVRVGQRNGVGNILHGEPVATSRIAEVPAFTADLKVIVFSQTSGLESPLDIANSLHLEALVFVKNVSIDTGWPQNVRRSGTEDGWDAGDAPELLGLARGDRAKSIELLVKPLAGQPDMVVAELPGKLRPGVYRLTLGERNPLFGNTGFMFAVDPVSQGEATNCVDASIKYSMNISDTKYTPCTKVLHAAGAPIPSLNVLGGSPLPGCPKPFPNPVVPGACLGPFRHGTLVKKIVLPNGDWTLGLAGPGDVDLLVHAGVDLAAPGDAAKEDIPIYAFADGVVVRTISVPVDCSVSGDENEPFCYLGYMVLINHGEMPIVRPGQNTYTLYLHMKHPPSVSQGQHVNKGDLIGLVGNTGHAWGYHTHFEIRHFGTALLEDCNWRCPYNIYGRYRSETPQVTQQLLSQYWENPETAFGTFSSGGRDGSQPIANCMSANTQSSKCQIAPPQGNVAVTNFYKNPVEVTADQTPVEIAATAAYSIVYYAPDSSFDVFVSVAPFTAIRPQAEAGFLRILGITQADACKLKVQVGTSIHVDPNWAGLNLGLSFCSAAARD